MKPCAHTAVLADICGTYLNKIVGPGGAIETQNNFGINPEPSRNQPGPVRNQLGSNPEPDQRIRVVSGLVPNSLRVGSGWCLFGSEKGVGCAWLFGSRLGGPSEHFFVIDFDETVFGPTISGSYVQTCFCVCFSDGPERRLAVPTPNMLKAFSPHREPSADI